MNASVFLIAYLASLGLTAVSGLLFLTDRVPLRYIRVHANLFAIPFVIAVVSLSMAAGHAHIGPWATNRLGWVFAVYVTLLALVVEKFSVRYLLGSAAYRKYFLALTIVLDVLAELWLVNDLRWLVVGWTAAVVGLSLLQRLTNRGRDAVVASRETLVTLGVGAAALIAVAVWLHSATHTWSLTVAFQALSHAHLPLSSSFVFDGLLVAAAIAPAAQWPFSRWLLDSVAAPTPVSAVMHAGFVNMGGILLARFSPAFHSGWAVWLLFAVAVLSILRGAGVALVHADYKRQLIGSTIAQMGFMLLQCAIGAYTAAIIHLILHGFFKSTLFLQSGSAVTKPLAKTGSKAMAVGTDKPESSQLLSFTFSVLGGAAFGVIYVALTGLHSDRILSAALLAWSVALALRQIATVARQTSIRLIALGLTAAVLAVFMLVQVGITDLLRRGVSSTVLHPGAQVMTAVFLGVAVGSTFGLALLRRFAPGVVAARLYLWLVWLGEPSRSVFVAVRALAAEPEPKPSNRPSQQVRERRVNVHDVV